MLSRKTPTRCLSPMIKIQCVAHQLQVPKQFPKTQIDTEKSLQITSLFSRSVISDSATPGTVLYHLPEFAQTPVHWVSDAAQPSHHVTPFSFCPQSFPASGSFPMSTDYLLGKCPEHFSLDQTLRIWWSSPWLCPSGMPWLHISTQFSKHLCAAALAVLPTILEI